MANDALGNDDPQGGPHRSIMTNNLGAAALSPFSFMDAPAPIKDDQKFDFVKDAMKDEGTKKRGKV